MERTSAHELAQQIIDDCLDYGRWPNRSLDALIERALDEEDAFAAAAATKALFSVVIERLGDLFDPQLCEIYARLFTGVIERVLPDLKAEDLLLRYRQVRYPRPFVGGEVARVFVLSRVTLGADIAVTSVVLQAAKRRFPDAEICFVGPAKNAELFAADSRIVSVPITYGRNSTLRERLLAAMQLRSIVEETGSIVIDPDSRLTQLGLIPVCDEARYYFFESRAFGGDTRLNLAALTALWLEQTFNVADVIPYIDPLLQSPLADCCVSWGVGENDDKRIGDAFELQTVAALLARGLTVLIDRGAGGAEGERVDALVNSLSSPNLKVHNGAYSSFAAQIAQSRLYVGYDSAGQHVSSAAEVPFISIFAGYASERMFWRWRPAGVRSVVLNQDGSNSADIFGQTRNAILQLT